MARRHRQNLAPPPPAGAGYSFEVIELGPFISPAPSPTPAARGRLDLAGNSEGPPPPPHKRLRTVRLDSDVAASFADDAAVNAALREYLRGRRGDAPAGAADHGGQHGSV